VYRRVLAPACGESAPALCYGNEKPCYKRGEEIMERWSAVKRIWVAGVGMVLIASQIPELYPGYHLTGCELEGFNQVVIGVHPDFH
jgi:hypothetical protein